MSEKSENNFDKIIVDEQITLRSVPVSSAGELFNLTEENREYLGEWLPWVENTKTVDDSKKFLESSIIKNEEGKTYAYGIYINNCLAGHIALMNIRETDKLPDIGYWISKQFSSAGIVTRCVKKLTLFSLKNLGINTITIHAEPTNIASNKVAEKSGYKLLNRKDVIDNKIFNVWGISSDDI